MLTNPLNDRVQPTQTIGALNRLTVVLGHGYPPPPLNHRAKHYNIQGKNVLSTEYLFTLILP